MARNKAGTPVGRFFHGLRYRIGEYCLRSFIAVLPWIPRRALVVITSLCARLSFALLWKYRARMQENVAVAMGEAFETSAARRTLVWQAWQNFTRSVLETTLAMYFTKKDFFSTVAMEGEDHLKRALARGKGVIALSAHLGNFTMIGARLAAAGYPFSVVVKQPRDFRFARLIDAYRAQLGIQTISAKPRREAVRGILKALRDNGIVLIIADEFKSGEVIVDFMGQASPAPRGPATLALRTGAATLPIFVIRRPDGRLVLSIDQEIELIRAEDLEASVVANTALFTHHLETMVRRYPEQWNWLGFPRNGGRPRSAMISPEMTAAAGSNEARPPR